MWRVVFGSVRNKRSLHNSQTILFTVNLHFSPNLADKVSNSYMMYYVEHTTKLKPSIFYWIRFTTSINTTILVAHPNE